LYNRRSSCRLGSRRHSRFGNLRYAPPPNRNPKSSRRAKVLIDSSAEIAKNPMPLIILPGRPIPARLRRFSAAVLLKIHFLTTPSGRTTFP
jgi:hypothetical protein